MTQITISGTSIKELKTVAETFLKVDPLMKLVRLPSKLKKFTVIRSPHVTNRSREQFQICTHKWILKTVIPINLIKFAARFNSFKNPGVTISYKKANKKKKNYTSIKV